MASVVSSLGSTQLSSLAPAQNISSWAEAVEQEQKQISDVSSLGQRREVIVDGIKTITDIVVDTDGNKSKVVTKYKVITKTVPKVIAARKKWKKFGQCANDPSGPQLATTYVAEEVHMQFTRNRAGEQQLEDVDEIARKARENRGAAMHCRQCKGNDHWSVACPYKELYPPQQPIDDDAGAVESGESGAKEGERGKVQAGTYIAPGMRSMSGAMRGTGVYPERRDENTCRVTNLPEDTDEQELRDLFSKHGKVNRIYLAKDKQSGRSKGFAFVTYDRRESAEQAIKHISGHRYEHLILKVEWAKQNTN